ncbi:hypothetical protein KJ678_02290 [Patescibacteria group bacterium]|nr:hypothetical protein [Patescibacteria group bacterium]
MFKLLADTTNVILPDDPLGTRFQTVGAISTSIINLVFWVALAIASAHLIITGVKFGASGGDKFALQAAKKSFLWGVVGFIVVIGFRSIIELVSALLGGTTAIPNTIPDF